MPLDLQISPGGASPIFRQIVDQVRLGARVGRLSAGEQLPSVRALAEKLVVNPNTIAKAYAELIRDGVIESQPGRGVFVAEVRDVYSRAERIRRIDPLVDALVNEGIALGFTSEQLTSAVQQRCQQVAGKARQGKTS